MQRRYFGGDERTMMDDEDPVDNGGTMYTIILSVMTVVTLGLIAQIGVQIFKNSGSNLILRILTIVAYIGFMSGAWYARSQGKPTLALGLAISPAVISCMYNLFDTGVLAVQAPEKTA
jgi:hypothetical protein